VDARNLGNYRSSPEAARVMDNFNCEQVRTGKYRRGLTKQGLDLTGLEIDHIVPRSLGGADHPANYQVIPMKVNRSLGNTWTPAKCASVGAQCAIAIAVSYYCGSYAGPAFGS